MQQTLFITGTDTGVGKTVLTALLVKFLRTRDIHTAALKPVCSGGRDDAQKLFAAIDGVLSLDEINPWHFREPVAPSLAARREKKSVKLAQVLAHAHTLQKRFDVLLIEGAGGILSPLGEHFDSRDLILALRAIPIIVAPNKLGAVNHVLLTLESLPEKFRPRAKIVLMSPPKPGAATKFNVKLLAEFTDAKIFSLPWLGENFDATAALKMPRVGRTLRSLAAV